MSEYFEDEEQQEEKTGSSGSGSSFGSNNFVSFVNLGNDERSDADNKLASQLAKELAAMTRIDLRTQGYDVDALKEEKQKQRKKAAQQLNNENTADATPGAKAGEAHPELAYLGGMADKTIIPQDIKELHDTLGQDKDLSYEAKRQNAEKKHKQKLKNTMKNKMPGPAPKPKMPKPAPRAVITKPRPGGV